VILRGACVVKTVLDKSEENLSVSDRAPALRHVQLIDRFAS
jgi:hypothetical protein